MDGHIHTDESYTQMAQNALAKAREAAKEVGYAARAVVHHVADGYLTDLTGVMGMNPDNSTEEKYKGNYKESEAYKAAYEPRAEKAKKVEENPVEPVKSNNPYLIMKLA